MKLYIFICLLLLLSSCKSSPKFLQCSECYGEGEVVVKCSECYGYWGCSVCGGNGIVECYECYGSGRKICTICYGKGRDGRCLFCSGLGYDERNGFICIHCDGTGKDKCVNCNKGYRNCNKCKGEGVLYCGRCEGQGQLCCDKCEGEGHMRKECPECEGSGRCF